MHKHALLSIIVILFCALIFSGVGLYRFANNNLSEAPEIKVLNESQNNLDKSNKKKDWVGELANMPKTEYILPTNQIYIHYSYPIQSDTKTAYELIVDKSDIYSMFCIKQTLYNENVDFTIVKDGNLNKVFLNTSDSKLLQDIILKLKSYDINSNVIEVKI